MWQLLNQKLGYCQPNALSKNLILSVLNSTATKREAKDYLTKYTGGSGRYNYCLLLIRHVQSLPLKKLLKLSGTVRRLRILGLRPICVIPPSHHVTHQAEALDKLISMAELKPFHLSDSLCCDFDGSFESVLQSQRSLFDGLELTVPIIRPYVYDKSTATKRMVKNPVSYFDNLCNGDIPYIDKFFVLNNIGGVPSNERHDNSHVFVNLSQEFDTISNSLSSQLNKLESRKPISENLVDRMAVHLKDEELSLLELKCKEHLQDLKLMNAVLSKLSNSSTGLITTIRSASLAHDTNNPLLHNLLTDRSLISSSLPRFKKRHESLELNDHHAWYELPCGEEDEAREREIRDTNHVKMAENLQDPIFVTTVFKKGVYIKLYNDSTLTSKNCVGLPNVEYNPKEYSATSKLNLSKLKNILDQSFGRELDLEHYLNRINGRIASVIVIGDYEGIAILTFEGPSDNPFVYLDKFAVMPHLKGSLGISDIIFNLMFKLFPKELLWRSRRDNVVNKWYFQRSVGVLDLSMDLSQGDKKPSGFKLFYYGDPKAAFQSFHNTDRIKEYAKYVRDIKPSWAK
ncbi:ARG2 (YJL071W) [Zygosaccharomyces parabailii]|nr:ARG2 (YJL071W) [Zygosaccharomyces parabailii]CDH12521.1 related to Amino-acid acetyltransferase,mitochondrial [Zygosaccharomyces bailii ISA1307]